jgi:hypothetical protein
MKQARIFHGWWEVLKHDFLKWLPTAVKSLVLVLVFLSFCYMLGDTVIAFITFLPVVAFAERNVIFKYTSRKTQLSQRPFDKVFMDVIYRMTRHHIEKGLLYLIVVIAFVFLLKQILDQ